MEITLTPDERRYFRDQLREGRAAALLGAEGFHPIVAALERLGSMLNPKGQNLGNYRDHLLEIAGAARAAPTSEDRRGVITPLNVLFKAVKDGRNDAVHQGAYARHLVRHCIELALLIEDGLMTDFRAVSDFMVRDPVCAELWQPVSLARQRMLASSFSYLPLRVNDEWKLLSDHAVAYYLSQADKPVEAIRARIEDAHKKGDLKLQSAVLVSPGTSVTDALQICGGSPVLVVEGAVLLGIATPFDFL